MTPRSLSLKKEISRIHEVARRRHRSGENARRVVQGISESIDGLLRSFFADDLTALGRHIALVAVGGYGRRELCPHSDVDLLVLCDNLEECGPRIERMVRDLWDCGFELGHSVRSPKDCLKYMKDDDITAAALLEARFLFGSESLMRKFQENCLNRYANRYGEYFVRRKLESLKGSIEGEGRSIFVTEPHIKDGMCCMRDIQHVLWIERLRRQVLDFADIANHGGFSYEEARKLEEAYTFYLRIRCELHFINNLRQDILEHESQLTVANNLGYIVEDERSGVENLMRDYYLHARNVLAFVKYYLETKSRGVRFLAKLRHRLFNSHFGHSVIDGHLYISENPQVGGERLGESILKIFTLAQEFDVQLSQSVCGWIRRELSEDPVDFSRSAAINKAFLEILKKGRNTGRILTSMHEVGVLGRIMPEFEKIDCLVTFDGHHQFTVDEHTLTALRRLDRIENSPTDEEGEFRKVLDRIPDRLPLRLALLLHDIGKSQVGSHDTTGTEAVVVICERLGLDEETIRVVEFLVYRHLAMFRVSERIDFTEEHVVQSFAKLVGNRQQLDMLYLLTYIDIRSVGSGMWTSWKGVQLSELFQNTCVQLETGSLPESNVVEALAASGIDGESREAVLEHCRMIGNPTYERETIPERMLSHVKLIETFLEEGTVQVEDQEILGYSQLTFFSWDRVHLFADLTGLLVSEGLNILGARIYSRQDGVVLDIFYVVAADELRVDMQRRVKNLRRKLKKIESGEARVVDLISDRNRRYGSRPARKPLFAPSVGMSDDPSKVYTLIEVRAGDRPGLLYDLSSAIANLGLDVHAAKVSTMVDQARDLFYVVESGAGKVTDPLRRAEIQKRLAEAAQWRQSHKKSAKTTPCSTSK